MGRFLDQPQLFQLAHIPCAHNKRVSVCAFEQLAIGVLQVDAFRVRTLGTEQCDEHVRIRARAKLVAGQCFDFVF